MTRALTRIVRRSIITLLGLVALTGCDLYQEACPAIYVPDIFAVQLDDRPAAGETWALALVVDGEQHCQLTLSDGALAREDGCGSWDAWLTDSAPGTTRIEVPDFTPEAVELVLTIDGAEAGRVESTPRYRSVEDEAMCANTDQAVVEFDVQRPL